MPDTNFDADYWIDHLSGTLGGGNTTKADVERDILLSSEHKKRQGLGVGDYAGDSDWLGDFYAENNIGGVGGVLDDEARNYWGNTAAEQGVEATKKIIEGTAKNQGTWNQGPIPTTPTTTQIDNFVNNTEAQQGRPATPLDHYGSRLGIDLGENQGFTMDFIDSDGDNIDDRGQRGPGMPDELFGDTSEITPPPTTTFTEDFIREFPSGYGGTGLPPSEGESTEDYIKRMEKIQEQYEFQEQPQGDPRQGGMSMNSIPTTDNNFASDQLNSLVTDNYTNPSGNTSTSSMAGSSYVPAAIEEMYQGILRRDSDAEGKAYWTNAVESGQMTLDEVENAITNSPEAKNLNNSQGRTEHMPIGTPAPWIDRNPTVGPMPQRPAPEAPKVRGSLPRATNNQDAIEQMYQGILGRGSDAEGKAYWANAVESGQMTLDEVANAFRNSDEARSKSSQVGVPGNMTGALAGMVGNVFCDERLKVDIAPLESTEVNDELAQMAFFVKGLH